MRVSVIIPTYNSSEWVEEAVSSVLAQTYPATEVIVVDDGSTDDTPGRMARFSNSVQYIRKENGGVSTARNLGIVESTGDLIAFLDADDVWHPRKLELVVATFVRRPDLGLLGTRTYPWPGVVPEIPPDWNKDVEEIRLEDLIVGYGLGASSIVIRAEVLRAAGPFDVTLYGPEDRDMWIRIALLTPVAKLPLPLVGYRAGTPGSLSKNAARMELGERAILQKLDATGVFRWKWFLRRKAWGMFRFSFGREHNRAGNRWTAVRYLALSLLDYPFPYKRMHIRNPFGRIRSLAAAIRNLVHSSGNA